MYMTIYQIKEDIYLDKFNKCYKNIITINKNPNDAKLNNLLKIIPRQKLSEFDYHCPCENKPHCLITFKNPQNTNEFLQINDIDQIFTILVEAGFKIEYEMTKLLKKKNNKLICFVSK